MSENYPIEFGDYRLLRKLAQGGMAEIFLAQDAKGSICAIKRILPHLAHEESFIRMFIDEARIVSHIQHENVAQVYDQGKTKGYYFIAMEFVQGHSLLALSERAKSMKIPLPRGLLAYIVAELLAGLGSAHGARDAKGRHLGIVHRDVTPQNVLISYEGEVKLIDFGVAKARARLTQTEAGFTKGKLSYMSPEQARGEDLDARSDLFSVGIVLHEITTGTRLFNKEGPGGILGAIVNDPIPRPSARVKDYPKELESIVMRALEKNVERRWQSADEMREALLRYAKKERPAPGRSRLKDLVHDLFGRPENQRFIEAAKAANAPTPSEVPVHEASRSRAPAKEDTSALPQAKPESAVGHRSLVVGRNNDLVGVDDTRMLRPELEAALSKARVGAKLEVTSEGTPVLAALKMVPEPAEPPRVRFARFVHDFMANFRLSWRAHPGRWILGFTGSFFSFVAAVLYVSGILTNLPGWAEGAADRARELKRESGLAGAIDAGTQPTVVRLVTEPPGATILVNGFGLGHVTPYDLEDLELGRPLNIEVQLAGYRPKTERVTLFPRDGLKTISIALERRVGSIRVVSDPPGARVSVDGKAVPGTTPLAVPDLAAGLKYKLTVSKAGRLSKTVSVDVEDGKEAGIDVELPIDKSQIPPGRLQISTSPSGCEVFVDDERVGRSPVADLELRAGPHWVRVACDHYVEETRAVTVQPGRSASLAVNGLVPNVFGYLTITPIPTDGTTVSVNGRVVPSPVEFLKVVPGRHQVVVENTRLRQRRELSVDVAANGRVTRNVNLVQ